MMSKGFVYFFSKGQSFALCKRMQRGNALYTFILENFWNKFVLKLLFRIFIFFSVALRPNVGHGLRVLEVSRSHTATHHSRQDSSGRVISASQRPLPDNTQYSQQTDIYDPPPPHPPVGFEHTISADERPQTYALDRAATGTGQNFQYLSQMFPVFLIRF